MHLYSAINPDYCPFRGANSLISSPKDSSADYCFIPGHRTCAFLCHFNSPGSIQTLAAVSDAENLIVHIAISVLPGTHFHLSGVVHTWVKCLAQGHTIVTQAVQAPTTIPSRATYSAHSFFINVPIAHYRSLPCVNDPKYTVGGHCQIVLRPLSFFYVPTQSQRDGTAILRDLASHEIYTVSNVYTAPGIQGRSPIQVLTRPDIA